MDSRTVPSDWFLCGFKIMDCLKPLHVAGQAMDLRGH